jgi:dihydrofolate reductase
MLATSQRKGGRTMNKVLVFNQVSLDGYFCDAKGDMSWAHKQDAEWDDFVAGNASGGGIVLFGRITYEMMVSYWPTPDAKKKFPTVARAMNDSMKVVFSRTLRDVSWQNTKLVKGDLPAEVRKMKKEAGKDIVVMGSGTIVSQLAQERLIDEYQIVVNPIVLGKGRTMFEGVKDRFGLKLTKSRPFRNGNVVLWYDLHQQQ